MFDSEQTSSFQTWTPTWRVEVFVSPIRGLSVCVGLFCLSFIVCACLFRLLFSVCVGLFCIAYPGSMSESDIESWSLAIEVACAEKCILIPIQIRNRRILSRMHRSLLWVDWVTVNSISHKVNFDHVELHKSQGGKTHRMPWIAGHFSQKSH